MEALVFLFILSKVQKWWKIQFLYSKFVSSGVTRAAISHCCSAFSVHIYFSYAGPLVHAVSNDCYLHIPCRYFLEGIFLKLRCCSATFARIYIGKSCAVGGDWNYKVVCPCIPSLPCNIDTTDCFLLSQVCPDPWANSVAGPPGTQIVIDGIFRNIASSALAVTPFIVRLLHAALAASACPL
jgi:hypothetical protein